MLLRSNSKQKSYLIQNKMNDLELTVSNHKNQHLDRVFHKETDKSWVIQWSNDVTRCYIWNIGRFCFQQMCDGSLGAFRFQ